MQQSLGSTGLRSGLAAALMLGACQGGTANNQAANESMATNAGSPANATAPTPAPANESAAGNQAGSLVLASDSGLPEPCQTLIREEEACIARAEAAARDETDRITARAQRNMARITVTSLRETLAIFRDDAARVRHCQPQVEAARQRRAQNSSIC
jgi:hypothetical protein